MIYTDDVKKELDAILKAFENYIDGQNYFLNEMRTMTESEEAECRRRITAILETIEGGGAEYLEYLDEYIQDYQERYAGDGGSC